MLWGKCTVFCSELRECEQDQSATDTLASEDHFHQVLNEACPMRHRVQNSAASSCSRQKARKQCMICDAPPFFACIEQERSASAFNWKVSFYCWLRIICLNQLFTEEACYWVKQLVTGKSSIANVSTIWSFFLVDSCHCHCPSWLCQEHWPKIHRPFVKRIKSSMVVDGFDPVVSKQAKWEWTHHLHHWFEARGAFTAKTNSNSFTWRKYVYNLDAGPTFPANVSSRDRMST